MVWTTMGRKAPFLANSSLLARKGADPPEAVPAQTAGSYGGILSTRSFVHKALALWDLRCINHNGKKNKAKWC